MSQPAAAIEPAPPGMETPEPGERVYFPELDGMRFIAFLLVYLFHQGVPWPLLTKSFQALADAVNLCLGGALVPSRYFLSNRFGHTVTWRIQENGGYGVQLFFILSGYLIATLLLREEARYGRIALRAFWIRRILRIWPLYYLIVLIGFFVLPPLEPWFSAPGYVSMLRIHLLPFTLFLGNWSMVLISPIPSDSLSVLWSVCVEEQFYLIVPLLIALVLPRFRIPLVAFLLVGSIAVRAWNASRTGSQLAIVYNTFAQFDTLCSGVLLALSMGWNRDRPILARWLRYLQWPVYAATVWLFSQPKLWQESIWHRTWDYVWVWMCGVALVMVAIWGQGWLRAALSYSRIVWLGKISYGLYMYHEIAIWVRARVMYKLPWFANKDELFAIGTFALVVAMAALSYYAYERRFLVWKRAWTRVPSRPV
jgi:peptidoglycan/LPS O-acetylase OafA/YrhL